MTTRRRPIERPGRARLTPEMVALAERYLELSAAHMRAITYDGQAFYRDGRREELCSIGYKVRAALDIKPWDRNGDKIIRQALEAAIKG